MDERLRKLEGESEFEYIKRIVYGKLVDKTIDEDYAELALLVFGQELSSTECRKRFYGIKRVLDILENREENNPLTTIKTEYDNYEQVKSYKETIEINKDGSYTSDKLIGIEDESNLKDENFLLSIHGYDPKLWQIVSARNSIWNAQKKGGTIVKLYASKINVKPRVDSISLEEVKESFRKFAEEYVPMTKVYQDKKNKVGKMLELPVMDLHYGKKAFKFEVGENIDSEITEKRFLDAITNIIIKTKDYEFEKIIFPVGQDFFHFDTIDITTTKGTRQDSDMRWQELFVKGVQLLIKGIDMLSYVAPVEVFYVAGNHDKMTSYYATNYLYAWYRKDERVSVVIEPQTRKYIEYGNCLIGYSHGSEEGKRISYLMQIEAREVWGRTKFKEWHLGHLHHENVKEENGIIIRGLSTLCGTDAWHYESGYVGSISKQMAFVWDKEFGLENIIYSIVKD